MKSEKLLDAIGMVGDDLIAEAKQKHKTAVYWKRVVAAAACLALVIGLVIAMLPKEDDIIPITLRVEAGAPGYGFAGDYQNMQNADAPVTYLTNGVAVTVKAVETLRDTYCFYDDPLQNRWRLVKMKTLQTLHGSNMPNEFYFLLPEAYMTDLTIYDALIIKDLAQYGYENTILYNTSLATAEVCDYTLFGAYSFSKTPNLSYLFIAACSDGVFDESLWTITPAWEKDTYYYRSDLDDPDENSLAQRGWTQEKIENAVIQQCSKQSPEQEIVVSLSSLQSDAAKEALAYTMPFVNGIFVPEISMWTLLTHSHKVQVTYRRYLNGYPTNETVRLSGEKVYASDAQFTETDMQTLPDLASALHAIGQAFDADKIAPPHIRDWADRELMEYAIFGWYAKTSTGIYGIIRIDWRYKGEHFYGLLDDKYYIITPGSDYVESIDPDILLEILDQGNEYVYKSDYDENGKTDISGSIEPPV